MDFRLHVWRQPGRDDPGRFEVHEARGISEDMSFLDTLDLVNERITESGGEPIAFEHDCREGICGTCGMMINGVPHGPRTLTSACQLHMREFRDGEEIWVEPWRATAFPVIKDLAVDRGALDRIISGGGYISVRTGSAPDANAIPVRKEQADRAFAAAACIGCGACVAACPNASAMLFTAAKIVHLGSLPQGQPERHDRVLRMVAVHDAEGFGNCTNHGSCEKACPKGIRLDTVAQLNRDLLAATLKARPEDDKEVA